MRILLGTRGSRLALAQTAIAEGSLRAAHPGVVFERHVIRTTGDARPELNLTRAGPTERGLFTGEIDDALLRGEIDAAVHSLKDLPTTIPPGLELAATLERAPTADLLVSKSDGGIDGLPPGATVGTSSLRRQCFLEWMRPDARAVPIRGNVPTRIRKLRDDPGLDAIVLAEAGILRLATAGSPLDLDGLAVARLDGFLPAPGQGAIALEARSSDPAVLDILRRVNHAETWDCVALERALLRRLGGGCHMPLGVHVGARESSLEVRAILFENAGKPPREANLTVPRDEIEKASAEIARRLRG